MSDRQPKILGILNITADSFSDGGKFLAPDAALRHAEKLHCDGADIIDIGPASSHPDSQPISAETEIERLAGLLPHLPADIDKAAISIDSYRPATQLWAIERGVGWLNDIHGFAHAEIYDRLQAADCRLFIMHAIQKQGAARRQAPPPGDMLDHIIRFFETRLAALVKAGIDESRFVLDPGMGFFLGDKPAPSLYILGQIARLRAHFNLPVLVSVSRKSFLRHVNGYMTAKPEHSPDTLPDAMLDTPPNAMRDASPEAARNMSATMTADADVDTDADMAADSVASVTLAAELWAAAQGVDYIRTHDVAQLKNALTLQAALQHQKMRQSGHTMAE